MTIGSVYSSVPSRCGEREGIWKLSWEVGRKHWWPWLCQNGDGLHSRSSCLYLIRHLGASGPRSTLHSLTWSQRRYWGRVKGPTHSSQIRFFLSAGFPSHLVRVGVFAAIVLAQDTWFKYYWFFPTFFRKCFFFFFKKKSLLLPEIAQLIKCLGYKHEDLLQTTPVIPVLRGGRRWG